MKKKKQKPLGVVQSEHSTLDRITIHWYCPACGAKIIEAYKNMLDYSCKHCGYRPEDSQSQNGI